MCKCGTTYHVQFNPPKVAGKCDACGAHRPVRKRKATTVVQKDVIEEGLKLLVQVKGQKKVKGFRGKLKWTGNLDEMRLDK